MRIMKNIEIEDIFIAITESAKSKIKLSFQRTKKKLLIYREVENMANMMFRFGLH